MRRGNLQLRQRFFVLFLPIPALVNSLSPIQEEDCAKSDCFYPNGNGFVILERSEERSPHAQIGESCAARNGDYRPKIAVSLPAVIFPSIGRESYRLSDIAASYLNSQLRRPTSIVILSACYSDLSKG